jgi:hypothetical protein
MTTTSVLVAARRVYAVGSKIIFGSAYPVATLIALCVAGCGPSLIVLQNPKTQEIVRCQGMNAFQIVVMSDAQSCARAYESKGFTRISTN